MINKLDNADDLETIDEEYDRGLQKKVADDPPVREGLIIDHDDDDDFHNNDDADHNDNDRDGQGKAFSS